MLTTHETPTDTSQAATVYVIHRASGAVSRPASTFNEACRIARAVMGGYDPVIGHPGDILEGGDRTLIWTSEEAAHNDDGARAVGEIRKSPVWE